MPHPDEGLIQAWLDGELEPEALSGVQAHLEACSECAETAEGLRRQSDDFSRAMLAIDQQAVNLADPGPLPVAASLGAASRHRVRATGWSLARAAGLVLVAAGAAAALVPGSPVREWLEWLTGDEPAVEAPAAVVPPGASEGEGPAEPVPAAGISVQPAAGNVAIRLQGFAGSSTVHVRLTDAARASVRVEGAKDTPRFVTGPGVLEVIGRSEGEIWVELPRSTRNAVVQVDGDDAVRFEGGRLVILWPAMDSLRGDVRFRIGG